MVPGRGYGNIGGAMDLANGAKHVIVTMEHCAKNGAAKIVETCTYPLTGLACVDTVITDLAVITVTPGGLVLREVAPGITPEMVQERTGAPLEIANEVSEIRL
jgi:3-oxoacid CoA-transferase subunit B